VVGRHGARELAKLLKSQFGATKGQGHLEVNDCHGGAEGREQQGQDTNNVAACDVFRGDLRFDSALTRDDAVLTEVIHEGRVTGYDDRILNRLCCHTSCDARRLLDLTALSNIFLAAKQTPGNLKKARGEGAPERGTHTTSNRHSYCIEPQGRQAAPSA